MNPIPTKIADLKPAPWNPREISPEAFAGLRVSLGEFGDLSGLVFNVRSQTLVCGHQRLAALKLAHGDGLKIEDGAVVNQDGERFPIRIVDWPESRERIANLAANNPHIAGDFTPEVGPIIEELKIELPDLSDALRLPEIEVPDLAAPVELSDTAQAGTTDGLVACPKCGFEFAP